MYKKLIVTTFAFVIIALGQAQGAKINLLKTWQPQDKQSIYPPVIEENGTIACEIKMAGEYNAGVRQVIVFGQTKPEEIEFSAESKAENVSGGSSSGSYGVYLDILHTDGSSTFAVSKPFRPGTHDWEKVSKTYMPIKPIKSVRYDLHFRNRTGKVWFKNATLTGKGAALFDPTQASHVSPIPGAKRIPATVPAGFKELPHHEDNKLPEFSKVEDQRGFMLFQRPITQPVYKNSIPVETERIGSVSGFATLGETEPLTFSIYPLRNINNMEVAISALRCGNEEISTASLDVRLVTEWPIRYPLYTSKDTYRWQPELLESVTTNSFLSGECQRYWIKVKVPSDVAPGLYTGEINISANADNNPIKLPVKFRVLDFTLLNDPAKTYSVYHNMFSFLFYDKTGDALDSLMDKEFAEMREYGVDTIPTIPCLAKNNKDGNLEISVRYPQVIDKMVKLGFKGPIPITGGIWSFYKKYIPDGKISGHWTISKQPENDDIYNEIEQSFRKFRLEAEAKGWPEMICCPMDEVAVSSAEFAAKVYAAIRRAGIKTYITKDPTGVDANEYHKHEAVDIWCSQPFTVPYEKTIAAKRYGYWSYPNHIAGELKDRVTMQKGGRMTYGFGLWRSGYQGLIPWNWRWVVYRDDHFDYLRGRQSGCGNRLDEQGNFTPAIYWECFREGRDDYRYLYTLEQAIVARQDSKDPACQFLVKEGKKLIQQIWDSITPQQRYLSHNTWADEEFNAVRWRIASTIVELLKFSATNSEIAPSVIADTKEKNTPQENIFDKLVKSGAFEKYDLGADKFIKWRALNKETTTRVINSTDLSPNRPILEVNFKVDHLVDGGGEEGNYPIGWPRIRQDFAPGELVLTDYDYFTFNVKIDSDRNEVDDDYTPVTVDITSYEGGSDGFMGSSRLDLGDVQRVWLPVRISILDLIEKSGRKNNEWKHFKATQFGIAEKDYNDGTNIKFELDGIALLKVKHPVIENIECPRFLLLPAEYLTININGIGLNNTRTSKNYLLKVSLQDEKGKEFASRTVTLQENKNLGLKLPQIQAGIYTLLATITEANKELSRKIHTVEVIKGFN